MLNNKNKYKVTLFNKALLRETMNPNQVYNVDKYFKTVEINVPDHLVGVEIINYLKDLITKDWEISDYKKIK